MASTYEVNVLSPYGQAHEIFSEVVDQVESINTVPIFGVVSGARLQRIKSLINLLKVRKSNREIKVILNRIKPDIVHLNDLTQLSMAILCKGLGYKVVMHARYVTSRKATFFKRIVTRIVNRNVDHLICIDGSVSNSLPKVLTKSIIYNPYPAPNVKQIVSGKGTFKVLFLANFLVHKGVLDLVEAAHLIKDHKDLEIFFAGGNVKSEEFYKSLKGRLLDTLNIYPNLEKRIIRLIEKLDLRNVKLLGYVKDVPDLLNTVDVLVFPAHMNEPSRSVFEAGFYGKPTILALKDKVEDVVEHGVNGLIVDEKSPHQLADAILTLKSDPQLLKKMGEVSRERFTKNNSVNKCVADVKSIYESVYKKIEPAEIA